MDALIEQKFEACGNQIRTLREPSGAGGWHVGECLVTHIEGEASKRATLFAAAPELLEAAMACLSTLESLHKTIGPREIEWPQITNVRAAIAKATGA